MKIVLPLADNDETSWLGLRSIKLRIQLRLPTNDLDDLGGHLLGKPMFDV